MLNCASGHVKWQRPQGSFLKTKLIIKGIVFVVMPVIVAMVVAAVVSVVVSVVVSLVVAVIVAMLVAVFLAVFLSVAMPSHQGLLQVMGMTMVAHGTAVPTVGLEALSLTLGQLGLEHTAYVIQSAVLSGTKTESASARFDR